MQQRFIWVHEDALTYHHPAFDAASKTGNGENNQKPRAVFVWDSAYFARQNYSLKRLTFIYECLMDLQSQDQKVSVPIEVYHGDTETMLASLIGAAPRDKALLNEFGSAGLYMADTPNPAFLAIADKLKQNFCVEIIPNTPFIEAPDGVDMTRFFRFWNRSRRSALGFDKRSEAAN